MLEKYYNKLRFKTRHDQVHEKVKASIRMMPEKDLVFLERNTLSVDIDDELRRGADISNIEIFNIELLKSKVYINPDKALDSTFAHEFAHYVSDKKKLLEKDKVLDIIEKSIRESRLTTKEHKGKTYMYVDSKKFVNVYQGRTYVTKEKFVEKGEQLELSDLREFLSVGYQTFVSSPQLLYDKNKELFDFFSKGWVDDER